MTVEPAPVQIVRPRDAVLAPTGGLRVRRTLPDRHRSLIGAWCFLDHFGPEDPAEHGGMRVAPHPHTALQTVTWLFSGKVEHRDSLGTRMVVRPGQLNLMTAGRGINHSEYSTQDSPELHGVQLWTALPAADRLTAPRFDHYEPDPVEVDGHRLSVFLGRLAGASSPVGTFSPLVGAEIVLGEGELALDLDPDWEYGLLADSGAISVDGERIDVDELGYLAPGRARIVLRREEPGPRPTRIVLIGGAPFGEQIIMWWNFLGRTHAEIANYRANWQAAIGHSDGEGTNPRQYGPVTALTDRESPIPAPLLPPVHLRPRG
ncbi:pirin family protein [Raineyella sp.]|uniref:pirin family protein n=1 Tax=Raineyella sp. TaxID=1911550 RepID=UPI002B2087D0|nr:pirin family protein [Raineyella sp.]MEA5154365.1 pirin family protein [Raineyella sp.]